MWNLPVPQTGDLLSTVLSKYHPLEDCSRLQAYADDSSLGLGVLVDGDFDRLVMRHAASGSLDVKLSSNQLLKANMSDCCTEIDGVHVTILCKKVFYST